MRNFEIKNIDCRAALAKTKNAQSSRLFLPENCVDAPAVLSAVYTGSTSAKNSPADVPQCGRSMIEMLGVLSVGGIAGYSKAMMKYRINKTIEQITLIAGNIRAFFAPQANYKDLGCQECQDPLEDRKKLFTKAKLVPAEMWCGVSNDSLCNFFGGTVDILPCSKTDDGDNKAFLIDFYNVPQEACIELVLNDWKSVGITLIGTVDGGERYYNIPVSMDNAINLCSATSAEIIFMLNSDGNSNFWKDFVVK